jgi:hypothetical protein
MKDATRGSPNTGVMMKITFEDIDQIEFAKQIPIMTALQQAKIYRVRERTIRVWRKLVQVANGNLTRKKSGPAPAIAFPLNANGVYDDIIEMQSNKCIIMGDAEIPDHDIGMFETIIKVAQTHKISDLIINGDFMSLDCFSKWARSQVYKLAFQEELEPALISLQVFLQTFKRIIYLTGNHERRLAHALEGHITIGAFLQQLGGVEFSEYAYCNLKSGDRDWLVCHQKEFSRVPMSVPKKICESRHTNVWCAHNHRLGWAYDPSGNYYLVEGGHCRSEQHTAYKMLQMTTHPHWNPGFGMLLDGNPYLIDYNNLDFWLTVKLPRNKK